MNKGYGSITYQSGEPAHIQLVDIAVEALSLALICNKSTGIYEKNYDVGYKMEDSLYLFAVLGLKPTKYDIVCCDEAQDFNICQIKMVERFAQQGSRVIFVGDPNQSIYAFRGSCTSAFA